MGDPAEQELFESEPVLRALLDGTSDAIYLKNRESRYVFVNASSARLLDLPAEAVVGLDDFALFRPEEADLMRAVDREVATTGQPRTFEQTIDREGWIRVYHTTKTPYYGRAGYVIGVIGVSRDVTEHKRRERALRESEKWQRLAVDAAHLGVWHWDLEGEQLVWTPQCRAMHGIGPDQEITYARFLDLLHPDDREATERAIGDALARCADYEVVHRVIWSDGSVHWLHSSGSAVGNDAGVALRMVGVAADVTLEKRAEQERAALLLRERAARDEAQAATRAKDDFLATLSHELRSPLQSMLGWIQMLKRPMDARLVQKGHESLERNVKQQTRLIEDLLDVSRIAAGKLDLQRQRVDLALVVTSAIASVKMAVEAKSIAVEASLDPFVGQIVGDPGRLEQVVINLLSNAVKFTPEQGTLRIRLERHGRSARIIVEDTGAGIAPELLPHVFERFRQAEGATARAKGGLGLGLAIVRHLVELHEGTVNAESAGIGQGARFTVTLPLVAEERPS